MTNHSLGKEAYIPHDSKGESIMVVAWVRGWEGAGDGAAQQQANLRAGNYGITFLFTSRRANWK